MHLPSSVTVGSLKHGLLAGRGLVEGQTEGQETEDRRLWNLDPQSLCHLHQCSLSQVLPELGWGRHQYEGPSAKRVGVRGRPPWTLQPHLQQGLLPVRLRR